MRCFFSQSPSLFPFFHLDFFSFPDSGSSYRRFFVSMSLYGCQVCQGFLDLFSPNSVSAFLFLHFHASVFYNLWQPRRVSVGRLSPRRSRPRVSPPPPGGYLQPHHISTYPQPLLGRDVHLHHQLDISTCTLQSPIDISTLPHGLHKTEISAPTISPSYPQPLLKLSRDPHRDLHLNTSPSDQMGT